jgi:hypothetical protein
LNERKIFQGRVDGEGIPKYLCVQILKERKARRLNPKVIAMILEDDGDKAYRRAGVLELDFEDGDEQDQWERSTLKLV